MANAAGLTPLHRRRPLVIPGVRPSGVPIIRETLFATGGRESLEELDFGLETTETANTPAGTHDGSDATFDRYTLQGVGLVRSRLSVIYDMTPATYAGAIAFVRIAARARLTTTTVTGLLFGFYAVGFLPGFTFGAASPNVTDSFLEYNFDEAFDDSGFTPWTAAKINTLKWGFQMYIDSLYTSTRDFRVPEFRVEVWG